MSKTTNRHECEFATDKSQWGAFYVNYHRATAEHRRSYFAANRECQEPQTEILRKLEEAHSGHVIDFQGSRRVRDLVASRNRAIATRRRRFDNLVNQWERETRNVSSPVVITKHAAIREIIEMGPSVVPWILQRMQNHPWFWFSALMTLTHEPINPVKASMRGDMQKMTDAWLEWGARHGCL